jgi:hypothetical protein
LADSNATPAELARRQRHTAVIERASNLLGNDNLKIKQFRDALNSYKSNGIGATSLIDTFFALFSDTSSSSLGTLVRDIADLYEDPKKAEGLRRAWNDWRAINEDYPSLPGPSGMRGNSSNWAGVTASMPSASVNPVAAKSSRVLKLKSSTAQSSRSAQAVSANTSGGASWTRAPIVNNRSAVDAFPSLPPTSRQATPKISTTPWVAPSSAPSSSRVTPTATPPISRPASRNVRGAAGDAFPSLPAAPKPTTSLFGYGTGMVRRDLGSKAPSSSAWAGSAPSAGGSGGQDDGAESEGQGRKKGNKGKKQVLVQWG